MSSFKGVLVAQFKKESVEIGVFVLRFGNALSTKYFFFVKIN